MPECTTCIKVIVVGVTVVVVLFVILIATSFSYLDYYEYGFKRQKSTGSVDKSEVYSVGRYFVGPDVEFKVFPADLHFISIENAKIFTSDKLEVQITATMQYIIRKDELISLHDAYDLDYDDVMQSSALDALKGAVTIYDTRELISNRANIEKTLFKAVRERLGGRCCNSYCGRTNPLCSSCLTTCSSTDKGINVEVKYFQLGTIKIPSDVQNRFMQALTLQEQAAEEILKQDAVIIRKETSQKVQVIKNAAVEIFQNATAQAALITSVSQANYTAALETARSEGLKSVFTTMGFSQQNHKNSFDYLKTIRGQSNTHLTVNYQQKIAGNL